MLRKFSKSSSVKFRRELHISLAFHLTGCESHVLSPRLGFNTCSFLLLQILTLCFLLFAVRYSSNPLAKRRHFGLVGGPDDCKIRISCGLGLIGRVHKERCDASISIF